MEFARLSPPFLPLRGGLISRYARSLSLTYYSFRRLGLTAGMIFWSLIFFRRTSEGGVVFKSTPGDKVTVEKKCRNIPPGVLL